jgi:hypothetical protein
MGPVGIVHLSLVLEHVLRPWDLLRILYGEIETDGVLCIIVPNEYNPLQQQLTRRWGYTPLHPHHCNYFTPLSLQRLAERAGFGVVRVTATFPMEWFALHGLNYVKYPRLGKVAHWLRMAIEYTALTVAPERWERLRDRWAARGWGREVELIELTVDPAWRVERSRWILIVAGGILQVPAVKAAHELGYKVCVSDRDLDCACATLADHFVELDTFDVDGHLDFVQHWPHGLAAVFTAGADPIVTVAHAARAAGCHHIPIAIAKTCADKVSTRDDLCCAATRLAMRI